MGLSWRKIWNKMKNGFLYAFGYDHEDRVMCETVETRYNPENPREDFPSSIAMIYRSELDYISRCILDYKNIETGGQLFGYWTSTGIPVILYALGPGRNANHQDTFFNQDLKYLETVGNYLLEKYGLQHIGEWHSHHQLGLAQPSGHDASTMVNNISKFHLRRFLLCIGNCTERYSTLNAFSFHENYGYNYVQSRWSIKECVSPFRPLIDGDLSNTIIHPKTQMASHGNLYSLKSHAISRTVDEYEDGYWLCDVKNRKVLADIYAFLKENETAPLSIALNEKKQVQMMVGNRSLFFPMGFPEKPVEIYEDGVAAGDETLWKFQGDILETFTQYYTAVARMRDTLNHYK